mgnify:CR=1 FL=1
MVQTTIFNSSKSQAVRLPQAVAMPEDVKEVDVVAVRNTRIITPAGRLWDEWFDSAGPAEGCTMMRGQPEHQRRAAFDD